MGERDAKADAAAQAELDRLEGDEEAARCARRDYSIAEMWKFSGELVSAFQTGDINTHDAMLMVAGFKAAVLRMGLATKIEIWESERAEEAKLRAEYAGDKEALAGLDKIIEYKDKGIKL